MAHGEGSLGSVSIGTNSIDFAENVQIKEMGRPRLAEYRIIGKQHTVYGQLGAESRQFTLSFNLTHRDNVGDFLRAIRTSTFAQDGLSLPEVTAVYGAGFASIRGICKNYNITIDESAGYSQEGHANRYKIMMSIAETNKPAL